jgi:hypothetical protein
MSGKKRQTFGKMTRERAVKERRERKQEKKEQKKLAAQAAAEGGVDETVSEESGPPATV